MPDPVTLVYDTDVAADDVIALSFLVSAPNVDLVGITVSGTGEAHCAGGVDVVLRLLERLDARDIPVACGRETPLDGAHAFPDAWRTAVDTGSGLKLPTTTRSPSTSTAAELFVVLAKEHPGLHVLATGPLTNLADALNADPNLAGRLGPVTVMGGALHVPGNIFGPGAPEGNALAEWNVYVDPTAAQKVLDSLVDPTFVTLDATSQAPVTYDLIGRALAQTDGPGAVILADLFRANAWMTSGYYLWDPLAAVVAAGYDIAPISQVRIGFTTDEGSASGAMRLLTGAPNVQVLGDVDTQTVEDALLGVLNGG
ncbi:MAG TPA: nucleoside hydrolase [Candidatus Limnocylindrales bacterium]|nr:nucleoside hydrolase [Candidatus Limnocylindrales bacterium]